MEFKLAFGKTTLDLELDEKNFLSVLKPNPVNVQVSGIEEVRRALGNPIGTKRLRDIVRRGERVVIITSDITRPMPSSLVLPEILKELFAAGVEVNDIKIVFALGSHRRHTEEEKRYLAGDEVYSRIQCIDSDPDDSVRMGVTSGGTPVDIFRVVAEADRRICLGNIEYHYFAGYSGGAKAVMPGVSTRQAIQANHSKMVMEWAKTGELERNPVRLDIEEAISFVPIDFILNVVLDEHKNIIKAFAGHYIKAHREGCKFLDELYKVKVDKQADIVVVSAGGYPKDINLYQAQKALDNAKHAVRKAGIIILVASCKEGLGEKVFEKWIMKSTTPYDMIEEIQRNFELGGHKAAAIAMVLKDNDVYLVSELKEELVRKAYLKPYSELQTAFNDALNKLGNDSKVIIMPYGGATLPDVESD
ncbi:MAG: nickel-dependent lactate racemase [Clostridiales bacterium]|jgi:nickel-dependent lactate racemase|nr:nickel-dependent lactate racemase [Clostridiales bacterium]